MAAKNPFLDFDPSKFFDPTKFTEMAKGFGDFKVPGMDVESLLASQRRNIEALTAANQLAAEGFQAVLRRQAEILRQTMEESSAMVSELMAAGTPEDKVAKQAELVKAAFEKAIANMKELAEIVAKSNSEAAEVLSGRVKESIEEVKAQLAKLTPKK